MQTTPKPLDFAKIEVLRRHMLLNAADMAQILGVSRMTYYGWVRGKPIRKKNIAVVKREVRKLLDVMANHSWPTPEIAGLTQKDRVTRLLALLQHTS
jgi:DNA-binding XRE family transcriptional regulator